MAYAPGTNTGHGHVWERPDGIKARCGGPGICPECSSDVASKGWENRRKKASLKVERVDGYLTTVNRLEPDIHMIDAGAFYASAAISLKRIADDTHRAANAIEQYIKWLQSREISKALDALDFAVKRGAHGDGLPADES